MELIFEKNRIYACHESEIAKPDGNQLQLLIRLLPDGAMSNPMRERCVQGQAIEFEAPYGAFYRRQVERPLVVLAGGADLSAFRGMLDELTERGGAGQRMPLYYGLTNARDLCEAERLEAYAERIEHYSHEVVAMNPAPEWQGKTGLIPEHLPICCGRARSVTSMRGMTFRLKTPSGPRALRARNVCRVEAACRSGAHRLPETIPARSRPARNARRSSRTQNLSRIPIRNATWFGELDAASTGARFATAPPLACM
jgi:Oxidoreductase FAD-binding domain/Oxidoreductase NAD-binding domain